MAQVKISSLPPMTATELDRSDYLIVNDTPPNSAPTPAVTRTINYGEFVTNLGSQNLTFTGNITINGPIGGTFLDFLEGHLGVGLYPPYGYPTGRPYNYIDNPNPGTGIIPIWDSLVKLDAQVHLNATGIGELNLKVDQLITEDHIKSDFVANYAVL